MSLLPHFARIASQLGSLWPRPPRRWRECAAYRAIRRLQPALAAGRDELLKFDDRSAGELTMLAECLTSFDIRLTGVNQQAETLDFLLNGKDEDKAHASAFDLFKKSVDLAHSSIGIAISQEEEMTQMEGRLFENRDHFARHRLFLHVLVLNLRAEAARIDPENRAIFATVADDMADMGRKMSTTVESAFEELETIVKEAAAGRGHLQQIESELSASAHHSIKALRHELDGIQRSLAPCAEANTRITGLLTQSRRQMGDLIVALQYQDIVHQQLEHVAQGFADLAAHVEADGDRSVPDASYLRQAAQVQQNHLVAARRSIEQAGRQIGHSSCALLESAADLVAQFTHMEQVAADVFEHSKLAEMFHRETDNLVGIATRSETTNDRITVLLDRIGKNLRVFSTEIVSYEFEVQLVALNAQIAAARLPEERAINKLAEETARLAAEAASLTGNMTGLLRETLTRLQVMRGESDKVRQTLGRDKAELASGSREVNAKLSRLNERILHSSGEAARSFGAAYEGARDLLSTLRFPSLISASFDPAEDFCTRLLAATEEFAAHDLGAEGAQRLEAHRSRYTMQQEHEADSAASAPTSASASPAMAKVPGEAVELFDARPAEATATAQAASPGRQPPDVATDGVELF